MTKTHLIAVQLLALGFGGAVSAQIVVDDRLVETKAASSCVLQIDSTSQRYIDCADGTVYDTATGLFWLKDAQCDELGTLGIGADSWANAMAAATAVADGLDCDGDASADLTDGSQPGDWRLASEEEWALTISQAWLTLDCVDGGLGGPPSLTNDAGTGCLTSGGSSFLEVQQVRAYWTSTVIAPFPDHARAANLMTAMIETKPKSPVVNHEFIWPVRNGFARELPFAAEVDGAPVETASDGPCFSNLSLGVERYVDCGDGTVLDTVTNLVWLRDSTCSGLPFLSGGLGDWPSALLGVGRLANGVCGLSDGSQPGDWRLPTVAEFFATSERALALGCTAAPGGGEPPALTDISGTGCLAAGATPFTGLADSSSLEFWTSEASDSDPTRALSYPLSFANFIGQTLKSEFESVWAWPVRPRRGAR